MKSRVDIFRPRAAATRGCRPNCGSATSIFRRSSNNNNNNNNNHNQQPSSQPTKSNCSSESEPYVISVPPGQWPPHEALSSASEGTNAAQHAQLDRSAPLPTGGTTSSSSSNSYDASSPLTASRKQSASTSTNSPTTTICKSKTPPSYYKIELVRGGCDIGGGDDYCDNMVQLTAGDDSSVQLTPNHNDGIIQLANIAHHQDGNNSSNIIIRASPIVEHDAIEHLAMSFHNDIHCSQQGATGNPTLCTEQHNDASQQWTISDNGKIIVIPPSPSRVSMTHLKKPRHFNNDDDHDHNASSSPLSMPPLLVKANSSSSSSSSDDSFLSDTNNDHSIAKECPPYCESESLESPPRMTRSVITPSLFFESVNGSSKGGGSFSSSGGSNSRSKSKNKNGKTTGSYQRSRSSSPSNNGGGCGTRFDFLSQILDVFSLNGGCCHQNVHGS
mmetsp:Transcript_24681/g.53242  ORF Transcript_24681/g.53242 Transcript_24681/m.53242 type:complete len:443 (+) Transcript_24681:282-1610(+)|eukprot:CAMPEP_0172298284 /NCGR_PEP_ID=MMETSP1058-20130122/1014_1 /TAXON_ID=83371 /ORGANISM="Detonula confervacea, Strain CCMP 353" /LENGTH=442 /DNA_ID=CAMNT_0013007547 /DNA_START=229 /DNA_END=1557 /DNA_ORIENTATION=-